jgi:hypothetical protein
VLVATPTQGLFLFNSTHVRDSAGVTLVGQTAPPPAAASPGCGSGPLSVAAAAAASAPSAAAQKLPEVLLAVASSAACGPSKLTVRLGEPHTVNLSVRLPRPRGFTHALLSRLGASRASLSGALCFVLRRVNLTGCAQLLEALLPYDPPTSDVSWMRGPMMVLGLVVVFGYQYFRVIYISARELYPNNSEGAWLSRFILFSTNCARTRSAF